MSGRRWWIATLLFLSTLLNYFDRQILSLVGPVLRVQFSLSASQYSHLFSAFLLGYTSMQFLAGWVVDRLGARMGLMVAMTWWSAAGAVAAISRTPSQLAVCLFFMGVGESANWPAAVKAVREWFSPTKRAFAVGFFNAGSSAGAVIAPLVVASLTLRYSWRAAFLVCGVLGLLWILPWRSAYRVQVVADAPVVLKNASSWAILRDRRAWGIILARFFADSIWYFYIFWLPDYLSHVQSLSLHQIGLTAWMPFLAAGLGNFTGGAASGYLIGKCNRIVRSRLAVMGASALIMSLGAGVRLCHTPASALTLIGLVVFAYSAWAANVLTLPGDIFPPSAVATVVGASGTAAGLGGLLTTLMVGHIIDHYSYGPVFWGLGCLPLLALACCTFALRDSGRRPTACEIAAA
jgi:ACS family hexuronate transporter-like MFS transporter